MFRNYSKQRCYIIAEIGGNFTTFDQAKILADAAAAAGVDAVKLQTYQADTLSSKKAFFDMENTGVISQHELFRKYEINEVLHKDIFSYIEKKGLDWFSTPSHESDVDMLERLGVGAYKIGSDDAVNIPFLRYIAKLRKPIILSTGMCTMQEIKESVSAILEAGNKKIILLHAITSYPTHPDNVNLLAIQSMMKEFSELDIGYSDHTIGITACISAAAMGARVVEKHLTYDKMADGPDHAISADPGEMKDIVNHIREFEVMKGDGVKRPAQSESKTRINNRKSIVIIKPVRQGEIITSDNIGIKRPGYGIEPRYFDEVVGRIARKNLVEDDILKWEDI
jgi:sialic acid synthase SpsE